jgi:hypothetical protein
MKRRGRAADLGLCERTVSGHDEEDEVRARHKLLCEALLPIYDDIRARSVYYVELPQQLGREVTDKEAILRLHSQTSLTEGSLQNPLSVHARAGMQLPIIPLYHYNIYY